MTTLFISILVTLITLPWVQEAPRTSPSDVDGLLERLEAQHGAIRLFSSPLTYRKEYDLEGDFETRIGEIAITITPSDRDVVLVFDRIIDASGHTAAQITALVSGLLGTALLLTMRPPATPA